MTLHQLKVFTAVARLKSFTLAGEQMGVCQPSVSLLVRGLAGELGVKLFERLGNKVHLTRAGEHLLYRAEEILARVEGVRERIDEILGLKKGKIAIGASALAATSSLPVVVQAFKEHYPGFEVIFKIQKSEFLEKELLEGRLDLAVMGRLPHSSLLAVEPYCEEEIVVIAPPNHPLTKKRSAPLKVIAKEPLIIQNKGRLVREMVERRFAEEGLPFAGILEIDAPFGAKDAIKSAVASGLGIGFLSKCYVAADLEAGRLNVLRVPELKLKRATCIVVHKSRRNSSVVQALMQYLRHYRKEQ